MNPGEERCERWQPLVVELEASPGSGMFRVDERLRAEEVTLTSDDKVSSARVAVLLDDEFDAVSARNRYLPDCRVLIRTNEPDPTARTMLLEGYPPLLEAQWDGRPGRAKDRCTFTVEHVYSRLARDHKCWIYGRRMRNGEIEDGLESDPSKWQGASALITALPCIFNLDGVGNCAPDPITVKAPDDSSRSIYIFADDLDSSAQRWTYLNALRYLFWFYQLPEGPVGEGNIFSATDDYVDFDPGQDTAAPDSELLRRLLAAPEDLNVEATNLAEALALVAGECGVHVTAETVNDSGQGTSRMRIWSAGDGTAKTLPLGWGGRYADGTSRFDSSEMSAAEVYTANVIQRAVIGWDHRQVVNAPIVIGGVKHYEMTMSLVPGWEPETNLDNVASGDRPAAKALAMTPDEIDAYGSGVEDVTWYKRYHKNGADFDDYSDVSRLWVLNEDGRFDGATYNRNSPFDDYDPFDFSTVATDAVTTAGAWTRRVRKLLDTITVTAGGEEFGVYVEVSFDSGSTWCEPVGPVRVRFDPTGIYFDVKNPTQITPPEVAPEEQNMWYAIIDQTFRVRVTALIESDDRLVVKHVPADSETPTVQALSRVVYKPALYRFESRSGTTDELSDVNPDASDIEVDGTQAANLLAEQIAANEQDGHVVVSPTVPWLETSIEIGDRLLGVSGRGVSFQSRVSRRPSGLSVLGKRYRLSAGHLETRLVLGFTESPIGRSSV
ncbi:MAG: hypothetical protein KAV82_06530 [Phycisphaerae bacterium]|nr:hypothetical protein [Phycisphaerae bacterium]